LFSDGVQEVFHEERTAGGHVMGKHAQLRHHVEFPHDVLVQVARMFLLPKRTVVLPVKKAFGIGANDLATVGDIIDPVALDRGGGADPLKRPVVLPSRRQLFVRSLPEKAPIRFPEDQKVAPVSGQFGIAQTLIVGSNEYLALVDHGRGVTLGTEIDRPADMETALGIPAVRNIRLARGHVA
jgi:hypothetical protein